jgi:type II restriction/modification system DNA methylase subunit YeeA
MTPQEFVAKWKQANLSERSACQQHFLDLCDVLSQPKPAAADPDGAFYTFERGVSKTGGGKGWADVWFRGHFGWEYKGKHKDLDAAYAQLLLYREALENPPLLVVCDLDRFQIHTNFTGTAKRVYSFDLDHLAEPVNLDTFRKLFIDPDALRPGQTTESVTRQAAERFGLLADGMRVRGIAAQPAAHFLMKLMFCMFAEDIGLLPATPEKLFKKILLNARDDAARLTDHLRSLFQAMASGGYFGADRILHFNGGLFADADVLELRPDEIKELTLINEHDWASVEPSIFGTLFERTLDPAKRSQIGAHYTSREDILTLLEPVVMAPLRREWADVKAECEALWDKIVAKAGGGGTKKRATSRDSKPRRDLDKLLRDLVERLAHVSILDPACGSGNFLYVAINLLLDLEKEVITYGATRGANVIGQVRPMQLHGIEINPVAQQLAQVVIWIGYLQWKHDNGFPAPRNPVLDPIESIQLRDAIIDLSDPERPTEPEWPTADYIVGNPPFLGNKQMRSALGAEYVEPLWKIYSDRLPATSDLCSYWFEKARRMVGESRARRVGLLATTAIKQPSSRDVLKRIADSAKIFWAISDRDWILDGAALRICMVGFTTKVEGEQPVLDGLPRPTINPDLTSGLDVTRARRLGTNSGLCFMGTTKVGDFDIDGGKVAAMLREPNPDGRPNGDVLRPWRNGSDIVHRWSGKWIIDFGPSMPAEIAARYQSPYEYLAEHVRSGREKNGRKAYRERWWIHAEARPGFRSAVKKYQRYIATARVAKHRLFVWLDTVVIPDSKVIAIAYADDTHFGVLQSRLHDVWSLAAGGLHGGERPTYNPTSSFVTFPMPVDDCTRTGEIAAGRARA